MTIPTFNRNKLNILPLSERTNKVVFERDIVVPSQKPNVLTNEKMQLIENVAARIRTARSGNSAVMLTFGAHTIKNCMAPVLIELIKSGWITHLATNGAAIIHDWEIAFQGKTSEDVRANVQKGQFGVWAETNFYINLAIIVGAYENLGYGESVGKMIVNNGLQIPECESLYHSAREEMVSNPARAAAAIDLAGVIQQFGIPSGFMEIPHAHKNYSVQAHAYSAGVPFTAHPMFGHDIIYNHPLNHGAAIGRTALNDFLRFTASVSNLDGGVYMSLGSAVMSPMIFEKALSMSQNLKIQEDKHIDNHYILVIDINESDWDWHRNGEPPADNPAYYHRFCKTFHRMGGELHYLAADNRDFLLTLYRLLVE